jgi:hypothetical protein
MSVNSWLGVVAGLLIMAGGHSFNSLLDYAWTGLDKGTVEERSAGKHYCAGQSLLASGVVTVGEVALNAMVWYLLAMIPIVYLVIHVGWGALVFGLLGMLITFWYAKAKFNWTHETALGVGCGPLAVLLGMYSTTNNPPWQEGILASVPFAIMLSFAGLALDEWPDAEANLKKGVPHVLVSVHVRLSERAHNRRHSGAADCIVVPRLAVPHWDDGGAEKGFRKDGPFGRCLWSVVSGPAGCRAVYRTVMSAVRKLRG